MDLSGKSVIQTPSSRHPLRHTRIILRWPMNKTNTLFPIVTRSHSIVIKKDVRFSCLKYNFFGKHTYCIECSLFVVTRHLLNICTSVHIIHRKKKRDQKKASEFALESVIAHSVYVSFVTKLS